MEKYRYLLEYIREIYSSNQSIPLHVPIFSGNEKKYLLNTIDSTYVSSVGSYVEDVEKYFKNHFQVQNAVSVVNGTCGLQIALNICGVNTGDEVITQALTFVATANSIAYNGATPVFVDVDLDTMGMSPISLESFLHNFCEKREKGVYNKSTGKRIAAVVPMHTFGFICRIQEIITICEKWNLPIIEDAAESLGSYGFNRAAGTYGKMGVFSFNGNKVITSGGGGIIVFQDRNEGVQAKHLTTTAKIPHQYEYYHDQIGFNYRMPNLNAALLFGQLENLQNIIASKQKIYNHYKNISVELGINLKLIPSETTKQWNYWLNSIQLEDRSERDDFLKMSNENGIMTRPIWTLLYKLPMYFNCQRDDQKNAQSLENTIVNLPSSAI